MQGVTISKQYQLTTLEVRNILVKNDPTLMLVSGVADIESLVITADIHAKSLKEESEVIDMFIQNHPYWGMTQILYM